MKTVAILGASANRAKYGNIAVRAFLERGYTVYPVNPKEKVIEGQPVFARLAELPSRPDLISVYLPPELTLKTLPEIAQRGCDELWLNPGSESDAIIAEAQRLGLNVIQACSVIGIGLSPESFHP